MNKKRQNVSKNIVRHTLTSFLDRILRGLLTRIYLLPLYSLIAVPWLVILLTTSSPGSFIYDFTLQIIALLAGKPGAVSLDETDIGRAMLVLFVLYSLFAEFISTIRGVKLNSVQHYKNQFIAQSATVIIGWGAASSLLYADIGSFSYLLGVIFSVITVGSLYLAFLFRSSSKKF